MPITKQTIKQKKKPQKNGGGGGRGKKQLNGKKNADFL